MASKQDESGDGGANSTKSDLTGLVYYCAAWLLGLVGLYACFVGPSKDTVMAAVLYPVPGAEPSLANFGNSMLFVAAGVGVCAIVDLVIARWFVGRYFAMHVVLNGLIIGVSLHDALRFYSFTNPLDANTCFGASAALPCNNNVGIALTFAVHIWHCFAFEVKGIDIIHHVPSVAADVRVTAPNKAVPENRPEIIRLPLLGSSVMASALA